MVDYLSGVQNGVYGASRHIVRAGRDLPVVIDCCRGEQQVVLSCLVQQVVEVHHFPDTDFISAPEKTHLLDGHSAGDWEVGVPNNLVEFVDTQSHADIATPPISGSTKRSEIDHLGTIMEERVNALVVGNCLSLCKICSRRN
jgi:hypothetical protein